MKLHDALKKIIREFGMSVLKEKRLVSLLADYKVFDDYPAAKQVMKSIVEDGYGKELCRLGMDGSCENCLGYAGRLKKTLSGDKHFKPELADYAVDCIMFSMGLASSVIEPADHGFDPFGNCTGSNGQIGCGATSAVEPNGTLDTGIQRQDALQQGSISSLGSPLTGPGTQAGQQNPVSAGSTDNQAPVQNSSGSSITPDPKYYSDKHYSLQSIAGWFTLKERIGRVEFWIKNILCSLLMVGFSSLIVPTFDNLNIPKNSFLAVVIGLIVSLPIMWFLYYVTNVWEERAHDLGEKGTHACAFVFCAYFSLLIFDQLFCALFLQTTDSVILSLVLSVPGGYLWIKYGFVKGRHS